MDPRQMVVRLARYLALMELYSERITSFPLTSDEKEQINTNAIGQLVALMGTNFLSPSNKGMLTITEIYGKLEEILSLQPQNYSEYVISSVVDNGSDDHFVRSIHLKIRAAHAGSYFITSTVLPNYHSEDSMDIVRVSGERM